VSGRPDTAREQILQRVRLATAATMAPAVARDFRTHGDLLGPALLDLLADRLVDYRAVVHRTDVAGLAATVVAALQVAGVARVGVPPDLDPDLTSVLAADPGFTVVRDEGLDVAGLDSLDGVLTVCTVAIAETGTIVLDGSAGQGRRALTLVPDHHLCVVHARQVVELVPEALPRLDPRRPQTWISGPSATSDIELQRVEGVHGPRRLDVVLVAGPS
jgi:L-lactate dehydrogenase complex protein LldG